jgi:hypothetical protein
MTSPFPSLGVGGGARRPIIAGSRGPTGCSGDKLSRRGRSYLRPAGTRNQATSGRLRPFARLSVRKVTKAVTFRLSNY